MPSWKIDTLDARGGLAFASFRDADLQTANNENMDMPCLFIGAPDFQPEAVISRAVALSAGRGAFQTGLYIGENEVSFPSVRSLVEFVRRCFLRSGGGDGADGNTVDLSLRSHFCGSCAFPFIGCNGQVNLDTALGTF